MLSWIVWIVRFNERSIKSQDLHMNPKIHLYKWDSLYIYEFFFIFFKIQKTNYKIWITMYNITSITTTTTILSHAEGQAHEANWWVRRKWVKIWEKSRFGRWFLKIPTIQYGVWVCVMRPKRGDMTLLVTKNTIGGLWEKRPVW